MGPLVFLSLGEKLNGEIDAIISPGNNGIYSVGDYVYYQSQGNFLNYNQVTTIYG
jgi:hypothetical protein